MVDFLICGVVLILSFLAARRSAVAGLVVVLSVGYGYGIARANLNTLSAYLLFDASVVGFYTARWHQLLSASHTIPLQKLKLWVALLMLWPTVLVVIPVHDPLIQLVGLRGHIFLLPFLLIGAELEERQVHRLAFLLAGLNVLVFVVAIAEFFLGVERFFPRNAATELIYKSNDLLNYSAFRIPSTFSGAHAYAGTMVVTLPLLVGAWGRGLASRRSMPLIVAGIFAAMFGVFMSATRTHALIMIVLLLVATLSRRMKRSSWLMWIAILGGIGWMVSSQARLLRFLTLRDLHYTVDRISWSVNRSLLDLVVDYPFGNGLGGGGTSIPYFWQSRADNLYGVVMENEYARILLEQGLIGVALWVAFIVWVFTGRAPDPASDWHLSWRLAWIACAMYFATGLTGSGLLTSIPQSALLLLLSGWVAAGRLHPARVLSRARGGVQTKMRPVAALVRHDGR